MARQSVIQRELKRARLAAKYQARPGSTGNYLKPQVGQWLPAHLYPSNYRSKRRRYLVG